jgi:hypothetical protein
VVWGGCGPAALSNAVKRVTSSGAPRVGEQGRFFEGWPEVAQPPLRNFQESGIVGNVAGRPCDGAAPRL